MTTSFNDERNVGQAPLSNSKPDDGQHQTRELYPSHVVPIDYSRTTLEDAIANGWINPDDVPSQVPADLGSQPANFQENPGRLPQTEAHRQSQEKPGWSPAKKIIAGGAALTTFGLAALGVGKMAEKGAQNGIENVVGANVATSAPVVPGQENLAPVAVETKDFSEVDPSTLTVDQFYTDSEYPEEYRIKWADEIIQERTTPQLLEEIDTLLKGGNRDPLGPLVPASVDNTGDEILTQQTVAMFIASKASTPDEARKLIAAFASRENPGFTTMGNQMGAGQDPILATYQVGRKNTDAPAQETPVFYQTAIGNYTPNGVPSKLIKARNKFDNVYSEVTVKFVENRWITVNTINDRSLDWIMSPQDAQVR
jgi:hypothetical protein